MGADISRVGVFLGVGPGSGGMFQYSQSILEALSGAAQVPVQLVVAYADPAWEPVLRGMNLQGTALRRVRSSAMLSMALLLAGLPKAVTHSLSSWFNSVVRQLLALNCDAWVFPAQDIVATQGPWRAISAIHDLMHRYERRFPEAGSLVRFWLREKRFRQLAHGSSGVLVDSEVGKQQVMESYGVDGRTIFPLPYAIRATAAGAAAIISEDILARYGLRPGYFFYPAQFWPHKNHIRLVDAFAEVRRIHPDASLVLAGGLRHQYRHIYAHVQDRHLSGNVHFIGYVPDADMSALYRHARALVMPTFFGPTNIPPLEAMGLGCPVLVSGIYAMPEQLGSAALYFDPKDTGELSAAMLRVWGDDDLAKELSRRGVERAKAFQPGSFRNGLFAVIEHVLRHGRDPSNAS